jgi:hypothetical protein
VGEGPFRNKGLAGTCSSRHHTRPCPAAAAAADRSMVREDTPSGHCTASARRTASAHHTVSGPRTAADRRTASCRRRVCGRQTAAGLRTDVDPEGETVVGSVHPVGQDSRSGLAVLAPSFSGLVGILGLPRTPSPGTADLIDTADREAGMAWAAAPRRLVLLEGAAFDLRPREEVGSASLQHCLVVVPPVLFGIRPPFSTGCGWYRLV